MAGNWIAIDHELAETPQVLGLIERTGEEVGTIIGRLVLLWSLADRQTTDGVLRHAGLKSLARQCGGTPEFWQAVADVGWLVVDEHGASIPRFRERFGESARKRMIDAKRAKAKRLHPDDSATDSRRTGDDSATDSRREPDEHATLQQQQEQQSKVKDKEPPNPLAGGTGSPGDVPKNGKPRGRTKSPPFDPSLVPIPPELATPDFRDAWTDWIAARGEMRKPLTKRSADAQLAELADVGPVAAVKAIRKAIASDWQSLNPRPEPATNKPTMAFAGTKAFLESGAS